MVVIGDNQKENIFEGVKNLDDIDDIQKMMLIDSISYLPDDILVKVDRAAMGVFLKQGFHF